MGPDDEETGVDGTGDSTGSGSAAPSVAQGAIAGGTTGAMVGGPWGAVAGAGIGAVGSLFNSLMQQQAAKDAFNRNYAASQHDIALQQVVNAQNNQIQAVRSSGQEQQGALGQLIAAISRTVR